MKPLVVDCFERVKMLTTRTSKMLSVFREFGVSSEGSAQHQQDRGEPQPFTNSSTPVGLVAKPMKAWQGSVGISSLRGIVYGSTTSASLRGMARTRATSTGFFARLPYTNEVRPALPAGFASVRLRSITMSSG